MRNHYIETEGGQTPNIISKLMEHSKKVGVIDKENKRFQSKYEVIE